MYTPQFVNHLARELKCLVFEYLRVMIIMEIKESDIRTDTSSV